MSAERKTPADLARRFGERANKRAESGQREGWRRKTYTLPRTEARDKAREWFEKFPKAAYMTEIEFWRELADGRIEFTIRRLPSAD
ncbi:MAG: hypothetical protein ABSC72_10830 [Methylovirgula sp.]|jgi:hypothetical protein